jgi:hypothetical protein
MLCTCAPPPPVPAPDGQYVLLDPPDSTIIPGDPRITQRRLLVDGDSMNHFAPNWGMARRLPLYAGDTTEIFPDSLYGVYRMQDDSTLNLRVRLPDSTFTPAVAYRHAPPIDWPLPGPQTAGKTYAFTVEGVPLLIHFETPGRPIGTLATREGRTERPFEFRGPYELNYSGGGKTRSLSYVERLETNRVRVHRLLVTAGAEGRPQLDLIADLGPNQREHRGPFTGEVYPALVPDSIADHSLLLQLSRGRVEVADIPPPETPLINPDLRALTYTSLTPREIRRLGLEFRQDGHFNLFTADGVLTEGQWRFSADRNFVMLRAGPQRRYDPRPITEYTDDYFTFSIPLRINSPEGPYYADVMLRFYVP